MKDITLAEELAAEIQRSLEEKVEDILSHHRKALEIAGYLRNAGMVRKIQRTASNPYKIAAIATASDTIPTYESVLYGTAALIYETFLKEHEVMNIRRFSRVETGELSFFGLHDRLLWKSYINMYQLLERLLSEPTGELPSIILTDLPLLVGRAEMLLGADNPPEILDEWELFFQTIQRFWQGFGQTLYPFLKSGPILVRVDKRSSGPIFRIFAEGGSLITPDGMKEEVIRYLQENLMQIRKSGTSRMLVNLVKPFERTVAYSSAGISFDLRAVPQLLLERGVLYYFLRAKPLTPLWAVEVPGGVGDWDSDKLDELSHLLIQATFVNHERALPVPLWLAKKRVTFPRNSLLYMKRVIQQRLSTKDLEGTQ